MPAIWYDLEPFWRVVGLMAGILLFLMVVIAIVARMNVEP